MATATEPPTATGRHIALLIDADNVAATKLPQMLAELAKYGTANVRRAYGDWTAPTLTLPSSSVSLDVVTMPLG